MFYVLLRKYKPTKMEEWRYTVENPYRRMAFNITQPSAKMEEMEDPPHNFLHLTSKMEEPNILKDIPHTNK